MSGNAPIRVYGLVSGLAQDNLKTLCLGFDPETFTYADRTLTIAYEGPYFFIEDFLDRLVTLLDADGDGKLDYIDQQAWQMTRYDIRRTGYTAKLINLNDVLERYNRE